MAGPQAYDWRELIARLELSGDPQTPSTLEHAPTRRILHSNMLRLRNANGEHIRSMHKISFKTFPEKRRDAKFVPYGIWRMMFFRRLAWVRMNEPSNVAAVLDIDLNGLPTTQRMVPDVTDNGSHISDGQHDHFIDLFLPIDEIFHRLKAPTNQQWIQHAIQQNTIHLRNLAHLRTILQGTTMPDRPSFRHIAFRHAFDLLFLPDGSPTSDDPFKFLEVLMEVREQIVADLAILQDLHKATGSTIRNVDKFLNLPDVVPRMERLAGVPSNSPTTDQLAELHPRLNVLRDTWNAA
ncbi:hypothetical protein NW768_002789 [Fusarium equiseti]|uniref:Uncharacterized protein n=1 Tax=Fusarium equiseti TaxID=61235 RepID=A0ABQ8RK15_FUSEQ|nr:hypothetical protein NW768_002789 [Fusarium equiseti]